MVPRNAQMGIHPDRAVAAHDLRNNAPQNGISPEIGKKHPAVPKFSVQQTRKQAYQAHAADAHGAFLS
jgi:hypothetical protein